MTNSLTKRILIIDDNENIHGDFHKVLNRPKKNDSLVELESLLFENKQNSSSSVKYEYHIDSAYQGQEALRCVQNSLSENKPYALAFVDMLMPPGWNGIETIKQLWTADPNIQMVICTAYSDYSWEEITSQLVHSDNFLILKKPFEPIEICQLASSLSRKWDLNKELQYQIDNLQNLVKHRTIKLEESLSLVNATLESTSEGILVINLDNKIIRYNQVFLDLWKLNESEIYSSGATYIFQKMSERTTNPGSFLNSMEKSKETPFNPKEAKLKNKHVLEIYRQHQCLNNKVIGMVYSFRDVTHHKTLQEQLSYQATHDNLTGLTNRLLLSDRVGQALTHARRYNMFVGFLLFDVDDFKLINDTYGHHVGDTLLKQLAKRLEGCVRRVDTISRLGGDEFVVLLAPHTHEDHIEIVASKLMDIFTQPFQIDGQNLFVTSSVGISVYPQNGDNYDTLLKNADIALYRSKELGRNMFQFFSPEYNEKLPMTQLKIDLQQAIDHNELELHYQPLIALDSHEIIGTEALIRWNHPTYGLISPQTLIPLAEKTGLIIPIGKWILTKACQQTKMWQQSICSDLKIAVNISKTQFQHPQFYHDVKSTLKETELEAKYLELEITEGIVMSNFDEFNVKMKKLKELGVNLAIGDFGTGYSNLNYLKFFPFDKIKIDKIFIDEITSNNNDGCIVDAIIQMSKKMNLTVLAEGVENIDQVNYLTEHHSDQIQGFYFSKPLNEKECTDFLTKKENDKTIYFTDFLQSNEIHTVD